MQGSRSQQADGPLASLETSAAGAALLAGAAGTCAALAMARALTYASDDLTLLRCLCVGALGPAFGVMLAPGLGPRARASAGLLAGPALVAGCSAALALVVLGGVATLACGLALALGLLPCGVVAVTGRGDEGDGAGTTLAYGAMGAGLAASVSTLWAPHPAAQIMLAAALAAAAFALAPGRTRIAAPAVALVLACSALVPAARDALVPLPDPPAPHGQLASLKGREPQLRVEEERWDALGHVQEVGLRPGLGAVLIDGGEATPWLRTGMGRRDDGQELAKGSPAAGPDAVAVLPLERACDATAQVVPYLRTRHRVLVLDGGALEVRCALRQGATHVDWVIAREALANIARREVAAEQLGDTVRVTHATPQAFLAQDAREPYDLIGVPGRRARHPWPFPLTPSAAPLLTREGLAAAFGALASNGVLSIGVLGEPDALSLILTGLEAIGGKAPWIHAVVARSAGAYQVLFRRTPVPMDDVVTLQVRSKRGPEPLPAELQRMLPWSLGPPPEIRFTPAVPYDNRIGSMVARVRRGELELFSSGYSFAVRAATDDRPWPHDHAFDVHVRRWLDRAPALGLLQLVGTLLLMGALLIGGLARRASARSGGSAAALTAALACLGCALPCALAFAAHAAELRVREAGDGFALAYLALGGGLAIGTLFSTGSDATRAGQGRAYLVAALMACGVALGALALPALSTTGALAGVTPMLAAAVLLGASIGLALGRLLALPAVNASPTLRAVPLLAAAVAVPWPSLAIALSGYNAALWAAAGLVLLAIALAQLTHRRAAASAGASSD